MEDSFEYPVSFNGKVRFKLNMPLTATQAEIEAAKEKAAEQERLAAILKSTERNIDAFIQEGLSKQHQQDDGN